MKTGPGRIRLVCAAVLLSGSRLAAQLPSVPSPPHVPTPRLPTSDLLGVRTADVATELDSRVQSTLRTLRIRELIRSHREVIEAGPNGSAIVRRQIVALAPTDGALARARAAGFTIAEKHALEGLELEYVVLVAPAGMSTRRALRKLRALDPVGLYDYNPIYLETGGVAAVPGPSPAPSAAVGSVASGTRLGLIDGGVDPEHPVFQHTSIHTWGCDNTLVSTAHGTAVASLMVGQAEKFRGAAPGASLYAADVYCGQPTGGAVTAIAAALTWLDEERVPVINISLVGPPNVLLERLVQSMVARGHILVAAVGNDGPAAPPLYPAAYQDVVGVTGVDARHRVLAEAGRGTHVDFAAPGADMAAAALAAMYASVRGTSFAAPIVAGLLSAYMPAPDRGAAQRALEALAREAVDLGSRGIDKTYGRGLVGEPIGVAAGSMEETPVPRR